MNELPQQTDSKIPLNLLEESPTNQRKTFRGLDELAESIKRYGVLQAILVRRVASHYEIVFGHRRYRAAKIAGLEEIPATSRELTDVEVVEAQIVENLHRDDIHPLEEADAYRVLHETHGYDVETIARKVGKSKAYIYGRMKLCALCEAARKPFLEDKLTASVALLIARIPDAKLQAEATKIVSRGLYGRSDPMSFREAQEQIEKDYMLRLQGAPFRANDSELVPDAGACTTCQKRTGNQRELFGDIKSADVCTDPKCFEKKADAVWDLKIAEAKKGGREVITSKKRLGEIFHKHGSGLLHNSGMIDLSSSCYEDRKHRTYKSLLGKNVEGIALARNPRTGNIHELLPEKGIKAKLRQAGHDFTKEQRARSGLGPSHGAPKKKKAGIDEGELARNVANRLAAALGVTAARQTEQSFLLRLLAMTFGAGFCENLSEVAANRGIDVKLIGREKLLLALAKKMKASQLRGLLAECWMPVDFWTPGHFGDRERLKQAKGFGVNLKTIVGQEKKLLEHDLKAKKEAAAAASVLACSV